MPVNLSLQEIPEIYWYESLYFLRTLPSWHTTIKMQRKQSLVSRNLQRHLSWKLTSRKPTVYTNPLPGFHDIDQDVQIGTQVLDQESKYKHLGSTVANNRLDAELDTRMSKISQAFSKEAGLAQQRPLHCCVLLHSFLKPPWTLYNTDVHRLYVYIMHHLHEILNVKRWQHIPNKLIQEKTKLLFACTIHSPNATKVVLATRTHLRTADWQNRSSTINLEKGHIKQVNQMLGIKTTSKEIWGSQTSLSTIGNICSKLKNWKKKKKN